VRHAVVPAGELEAVDPGLRSFENVNEPADVTRLGLLPPRDSPRTQQGVARRPAVRLEGGRAQARVEEVAVEEPLELRLDGETIAVTMRTPGADRQLALGFLFAEGIVERLDDVGSLAPCGRPGEPGFGNVLDVRSSPGKVLQASRSLESRRFGTTSSACGVCGRQGIDDLLARVRPIDDGRRLAVEAIRPEALRELQPNFARTGGVHAAAAFGEDGAVLASHEDVGRHNAVDKVTGELLEAGRIGRAVLLLVSGRASFEIVQKAVVARIPIVASVSAASSLAIDLADRCGLTLAAFARDGRVTACAHGWRLGERQEGGLE
jgi:FdhD protein